MIFVDGIPFRRSGSSSQGREILVSLLKHPAMISSSSNLKATPEMKLPAADRSPPAKHVYVFQREYATVDPALVELVGTDEATTCVGLVIRNQKSGMISIGHLDFEGVVDSGLAQMLSLLVDNELDAALDVHMVGGFEDAPYEHISNTTGPENHEYQCGYSFPLCSKIIEALQNSPESFHLQTLCVLGHNTKRDSCGNPCPIISGFLVDTSSGSILPANFDTRSRCPDEIVRRIRVTVSSEDPSWKGKLLETYDTHHDRFHIAPCSWMPDWGQYAFALQQSSDSEILYKCSTSPFAEGPDFVENERRFARVPSFTSISPSKQISPENAFPKFHIHYLSKQKSPENAFTSIFMCRIWSYLIKYPDCWLTFPGKKPRVFQRAHGGGWMRRN